MCVHARACVCFVFCAFLCVSSDRASESGLCKQVTSILSCNSEAVSPTDCTASRPEPPFTHTCMYAHTHAEFYLCIIVGAVLQMKNTKFFQPVLWVFTKYVLSSEEVQKAAHTFSLSFFSYCFTWTHTHTHTNTHKHTQTHTQFSLFKHIWLKSVKTICFLNPTARVNRRCARVCMSLRAGACVHGCVCVCVWLSNTGALLSKHQETQVSRHNTAVLLFMPRRVCQNKAFSHVCHLCQNMEPLEVVVLPLSIFLCLILRNEPFPFIYSAGVLEQRDGAEKDWRTSYSMKRKRTLCHLPECLSVFLTPHCGSSSSFSSELNW